MTLPSHSLDSSLAEKIERMRDLRVQGSLDEAETLVRQLLLRHPELAVLHDQLGRTHQARGRLEPAVAAYLRALEIDPGRAETHLQLGLARERQGAPERAAASYRRAASLDPSSPLPALNLGILAVAAGRTVQAIGHFRDAVDRAPGLPLAHQQLAYALLRDGELAEGFREHEWRFEQGGGTPTYPGTGAPVWDGRALDGKTLMIFCEQGYGTRMQMIRYASLAARRGARVVCLAEGPEARLLATCPGVSRVYTVADYTANDSLPHFDVQAPITSLPKIFATTLDTVPAEIPYLGVADGVAVEPGLLGSDGRLRVGFVWASGEAYSGASRDAPPAAFAPLGSIPGVRLFSFQFDERRAALEQAGADVVDLAPWLGDFGKPVWLLLPQRADWRWLEDREDSPWYPSLRLYRQRDAGDWSPVFQRVTRDLRQRLRRGG